MPQQRHAKGSRKGGQFKSALVAAIPSAGTKLIPRRPAPSPPRRLPALEQRERAPAATQPPADKTPVIKSARHLRRELFRLGRERSRAARERLRESKATASQARGRVRRIPRGASRRQRKEAQSLLISAEHRVAVDKYRAALEEAVRPRFRSTPLWWVAGFCCVAPLAVGVLPGMLLAVGFLPVPGFVCAAAARKRDRKARLLGAELPGRQQSEIASRVTGAYRAAGGHLRPPT